jgi:hypothetical protein
VLVLVIRAVSEIALLRVERCEAGNERLQLDNDE